MASMGRKMESLMCFAFFLYYVIGVSERDHRLLVSTAKVQYEDINITATAGSNITLVCVIPTGTSKYVAWYKSPEMNCVADMNIKENHCKFIRNNNERLFVQGCNNTDFRILIRNIQKKDEGKWYCHSDKGSSQKLGIDVQIHKEETTTASKEKLTSTSIITEDHTEVLISKDVSTSHTDQRKDSRASRPSSDDYSIPAVAGSIGAIVLLAVIVAIITSVLRAWKDTHTDSDSDQDSLGGLKHNYNVYGWHIIGEGAEASELKVLPSKDSLTDLHSVVAMYVRQGRESPKALTPDENVSGMYSVDQKCVELQGAKVASTTDLNGLFDVYSVGQESPKCWMEDN